MESHGRAHRGFDHGRAGDDADRPEVYQVMRDAAIRIIREIGVAAGGCNIQFAVSATGERLVMKSNHKFPLIRPGLQGDRVSRRADRDEGRRGCGLRRITFLQALEVEEGTRAKR